MAQPLPAKQFFDQLEQGGVRETCGFLFKNPDSQFIQITANLHMILDLWIQV